MADKILIATIEAWENMKKRGGLSKLGEEFLEGMKHAKFLMEAK